jgi:hypothetical protein
MGYERRVRKLLTLFLFSVISLGAMLVAPLTAAAIPPGGWCYSDWYDAANSSGEVQQPYGTLKQFTNNSLSTATWAESMSVTTTFSSTTTTTTHFQAGVDLKVVKFGVDSTTQVVTTITITVNKTTGFTVAVPPGVTMYAQYGAFGINTSGTYNQDRYGCDNHDFETLTSGPLTAFSLTSEGWRLWQA